MDARGAGTEDRFSLLGKTLKEGERILAPTRRPDGTLRKPIRIRAGYVPQDEVAIYQSKGALLRKGMGAAPEVPPGYDPVLDAKPKTKAAKRNERKKEKKHQAALEKGKNIDLKTTVEVKSAEVLSHDDEAHRSENVESVACQLRMLAVSDNVSVAAPFQELAESSNLVLLGADLDKRIRALKKKIRLTEAQLEKTNVGDLKPEQLEKVAKLDDWHKELELLEDKKSELSAS